MAAHPMGETACETIRITVLGSGTSSGVPTIGCSCSVCASTDPRDNRLRPSVLVQYLGYNVLIDTTPDFRFQALRADIRRVDAILLTHAHADHILGLDDVRPLNYHQKMSIPVYGTADSLEIVRRVFRYAFDGQPSLSSSPKVELRTITEEPFDLFGLTVIPIRLTHGDGISLGFRFGNLAYLTDHGIIPDDAKPKLRGLDVLFLDALRHRPHPTHSTVAQSLQAAEELAPRRAYFTHICHDLAHEQTEATFPPHVRLAYDGLAVEVPLPQGSLSTKVTT
jgi:phosphoribosyl 1,2-cyclic phosphate phosphodiesterase